MSDQQKDPRNFGRRPAPRPVSHTSGERNFAKPAGERKPGERSFGKPAGERKPGERNFGKPAGERKPGERAFARPAGRRPMGMAWLPAGLPSVCCMRWRRTARTPPWPWTGS